MNKLNIKSIILTLFAFMLITSSCNDDVDIDVDSGDKYETSNSLQAAIISQSGLQSIGSTSFRGVSTYNIFVETNKVAASDITGTVIINDSILSVYNRENGTSYTKLPADAYTLNKDGAFAIAKGLKKSDAISINFNSKTKVDPSVVYAIPFDVKFASSDISLSKTKGTFLLFVQDYNGYPAPGNKNGIKIISCMEINDVNPLNNLSYTLKTTGQPLIDMVILFSSNINYDGKLDRPYILQNTEMTNILANRDKYLKPLQDRGIKVMLSLLGNWDRAGVANMDDNTAKLFAQEIKNTLDVYNLDGVMFDDEYSSYQNPPPPGFVKPSSEAAGRLMYETKKAIGDKLVFSYIYGKLSGPMPTIDGVDSGQYVDYALSDYFRDAVSADMYPGMTKKQKSPWSQEFARGYILPPSYYERVVSEGYGAHMIFALNPNEKNFEDRQLPALKSLTNIICEDELVYDGVIYPADYK